MNFIKMFIICFSIFVTGIFFGIEIFADLNAPDLFMIIISLFLVGLVIKVYFKIIPKSGVMVNCHCCMSILECSRGEIICPYTNNNKKDNTDD